MDFSSKMDEIRPQLLRLIELRQQSYLAGSAPSCGNLFFRTCSGGCLCGRDGYSYPSGTVRGTWTRISQKHGQQAGPAGKPAPADGHVRQGGTGRTLNGRCSKDCGEFRTNWDGIVSNWTQLAREPRGSQTALEHPRRQTARAQRRRFDPRGRNGFTGACPTSTRKFHASRNCSRSWGPRCSRGCWPRCCSSTFRSSAPCPCSLRRCGPSVRALHLGTSPGTHPGIAGRTRRFARHQPPYGRTEHPFQPARAGTGPVC